MTRRLGQRNVAWKLRGLSEGIGPTSSSGLTRSRTSLEITTVVAGVLNITQLGYKEV